MQEDSGPNHSLDKKRKAVQGSNSVVDTSEKRIRKSKNQEETGVTVKQEEQEVKASAQWPDYFKEVSIRENSLKLTLGTSFCQLFKVRSALILDLTFPDSFLLVSRYSRFVLSLSTI